MADVIQTIKYSVSMQANPMKPEEGKKAYATLQSNGTVSLAQLARHIKEHGSPYGRDVITGVLIAIVDCTMEYLEQGYKVDLGDLGAFYPGIKRQEGAVDVTNDDGTTTPALKAFGSNNIKELKVNYALGAGFEGLTSRAGFKKVAPRKAQDATIEAQTSGQDSASWAAPEEGDGDGQQEP